jgi:uncharacterized protein YkwD
MRFQTLARGLALAGLLGLGTAIAGPLVDAQPRFEGLRVAGYQPESVECQALRKMNAFRQKHGKPPLALSATLGAAAEYHSRDMAAKNYFDHNLRGGISWDENIRRHGYRDNPIGENIAAGMETAAGVVNAWKRSPDHRKGMLEESFSSVGIGRAHDRRSAYGYYWTANFGGKVDREISCN